MKPIHFILALLCLTISCQKKFDSNSDSSYPEVVKSELRQRMSPEDFENLDFGLALPSVGDSGRLFSCQIPFKNKTSSDEFVLLETNVAGHIELGKIIHLNLDNSANKSGSLVQNSVQSSINSDILIQSLSRKVELTSSIKGGFIQSFHHNEFTARESYVTPDPYVELPEVIIVAPIPLPEESAGPPGIQ